MFTWFKLRSYTEDPINSRSSIKMIDGEHLLASPKRLIINHLSVMFAISIAETGKNETPALRATR